jgi:prevent-host-death family protein
VPKKTYGAEEARTHLPKLLERAHRGYTTLITRRGQPYAVVAPVDHVPAQRNIGGVLSLQGTGKSLWGEASSKTVDRLRDEWS